MKKITHQAVCALLWLCAVPATGSADDNPSPDLAGWMDAAIAGVPLPVTNAGDALQRDEVHAQQALLWRAYKEAAKRADWNNELLEVPPPVDKQADNEKLEVKAGKLKSKDKIMPYALVAKGQKPADGWPLFISMHGGGRHHGREKIEAHGWSVNSREWQTQMMFAARVYKPAGLYFLPRMADDRMGRWWHRHNIDIFTRMIRLAILFNEVDPNRIYIMGISQGGYGTCHLAPFLADHFAAAGPMAGGMMTVTENLRNLPFRSDIGEFDTAYNRIALAKQLHAKIDGHKENDSEAYVNLLAVQKGRGHGIDYSNSPNWLAQHTRDPYPEKIVWRCHAKDGQYRDSFYWISLTTSPEKGEIRIEATYDRGANAVTIEAKEQTPAPKKDDAAAWRPFKSSKIVVHLNDNMLDLDKQVAVRINDQEVFKGIVKRTRETMMRNIVKRGDPNYAFPAELMLPQD